MDYKTALQNLDNVCKAFNGTREQHGFLAQSLQTLKDICENYEKILYAKKEKEDKKVKIEKA